MGLGEVRPQRQAPPVAGHGFVQLALDLEGVAEIDVRRRQVRHSPQRLAVAGGGLGQFLWSGEDQAEVVVGHGEVGLSSRARRWQARASSSSPCSCKTSPRPSCATALDGSSFDRPPVTRGGLVVFPLLIQGPAQIAQRVAPVGMERQGPPDALHSRVVPAKLGQDHAQEVPGVGLTGIGREDLAIDFLGRRQAAGLVVRNGDRELWKSWP